MTVSVAAATWSKSQMANLSDCERKFYFGVAAGDGSLDETLTKRISDLKKIKNRYLWIGSFLHDEVGQILKSVRQGEGIPEAAAVVQTARERLRQQFKSSKDGDITHRLFEHEFNVVLSADAWGKQWETVEKGLTWFLHSKWLSRLAALGPECWKAVDEILAFDVDGTKAYVKIDCAVEIEGKFFLIDWKTSNSKLAVEDGLQVAALYAHEVWGAEPDKIQGTAISLLDGAAHHAHIDEDSLMQTFLKIQEESARLEELRNAMAQIASYAELPMAPADTCRQCSFQKICHAD